MSSIRQAAEDYLRIRRSLGFKLETAGRLLPQFRDYLESAGGETITIEHAVARAGRAVLPSEQPCTTVCPCATESRG